MLMVLLIVGNSTNWYRYRSESYTSNSTMLQSSMAFIILQNQSNTQVYHSDGS
jgi:hypothetical protein